MDLDPAAEGQGPNPLQQVESGALEGEICQGQCPPQKSQSYQSFTATNFRFAAPETALIIRSPKRTDAARVPYLLNPFLEKCGYINERDLQGWKGCCICMTCQHPVMTCLRNP